MDPDKTKPIGKTRTANLEPAMKSRDAKKGAESDTFRDPSIGKADL